MFNVQISDYNSCNPTLLNLFFSSGAGICSTMAFTLGNFDHAVVSVFMDFLSNSKGDAPFHRLACDYPCFDWGGLHDHFRDAPWKDIFIILCFCYC